MTVPATEPVVPTAPVVPTEPAAAVTEPPAPPELGDAGKRALDEERKARKAAEKTASDLAAKVKEFEDASKSDAEKAAARAEAAEKALAEMTVKALRLEVADALQVPAQLRKYLTAGDEESLREQANDLLTTFNAAMAENGSRLPKPDPNQGAKPTSADPADLDRQIAEALAAGDIARSVSLKRQKAYAPTP